jgi:hypothetical protein
MDLPTERALLDRLCCVGPISSSSGRCEDDYKDFCHANEHERLHICINSQSHVIKSPVLLSDLAILHRLYLGQHASKPN